MQDKPTDKKGEVATTNREIIKVMFYGETKRVPKRKATFEEQFQTMPDAIRRQVIPRIEAPMDAV